MWSRGRIVSSQKRNKCVYWTRKRVQNPTETRMTVTLSAQPRLTASLASCWQAASYLSSSSLSSASTGPVRCTTAVSCGRQMSGQVRMSKRDSGHMTESYLDGRTCRTARTNWTASSAEKTLNRPSQARRMNLPTAEPHQNRGRGRSLGEGEEPGGGGEGVAWGVLTCRWASADTSSGPGCR